jgi:hypothetical protein
MEGLAAITPRMAKAFFRKAGVPGFENFSSVDDLLQETEQTVAIAVSLATCAIVQAISFWLVATTSGIT